jgi:mono/diheme cytochrome c family protein
MMSSRGTVAGWKGIALSAGLMACMVLTLYQNGLAATEAGADTKPRGHAEAGRSVFNGKGVCYYCHGIDGHRDTLPQVEAGTAALIAQLNPQPADLRNPKSLRLTSDKARAKVIREGHPGTGMFPDTTITDQELADTLAYLAVLRKEGRAKLP